MIISDYDHELFPQERKQVFKDYEDVIAVRRELEKQMSVAFEQEYPDYHGENWSYA
jgi:hypothetical protein